MNNHEIPVADVEVFEQLMLMPYRYRQEAQCRGQLTFDWTLPPDDSLKVYRANLRALRGNQQAEAHKAATEARHVSKFGHEMARDARGKCKTCNAVRLTKRYRMEHGIPLDAPLMSPREAGGRWATTATRDQKGRFVA